MLSKDFVGISFAYSTYWITWRANRLHDAIGDLDGDDHLDLALEEDRELLKQYKEYLAVR